MSNGWFQLEKNRPQKGGPHVPVATPPPPRPTPPPPRRPGPPPRERRGGEMPETLEPRFPISIPEQPKAVEKVSRPEGERAIYIKGWGAFGHFENYRSMSEVTMLPFLQQAGQCTSTASRFALATSSRGTPDAARNVWGFSTKFYTGDGVFDLLCNHLPVFSVREGMNFLESVRAMTPAYGSHAVDAADFWARAAQTPEATHFLTWLYSDVGTVKNLRHLRTYGFDTHIWRNKAGEGRYAKYHWIPMSGTEFITAREAAALTEDPDVAGRDLRTAIAGGYGPEYELRVQLMDLEEARRLDNAPLDGTRVWEEETHPLLPVGRLTLEENPDGDEVEGLSFSPANLLPGAERSGDRWLQVQSFPDWSGQFPKAGKDQGDFDQAGKCYRALSQWEKRHLEENIAAALSTVSEEVQATILDYLTQADEEYGAQVAEKMKAKN